MNDPFLYRINALQTFVIDAANPEKTWNALREKCPSLSEWGVELLRSGLDGFVQSIILEPYYTCKDHRNLFSNFYSKKFLQPASTCARLHFFDRSDISAVKLAEDPGAAQDSYIGHSVIRPVKDRCIGRTVIDPYKLGKTVENHFYLLRTPFRAQINGAHLHTKGYPFTSQDADATLCAHSALWGVCRYLSERYTHYRELHPYDFIRMTESREGRAVPYRGMTYTDYCKILTEFGTFPIYRVMQKKDATPEKPALEPSRFDDLYSYVESGFPVLTSLRGVGHVITVIGHTLDVDRKIDMSAPFINSSAFVKQFIVSDDNFFPYQLLGYAGDPENYGNNYKSAAHCDVGIEHLHVATCPLPEKVFLPAEDAHKKALKVASKCESLIRATGNGPLITRLFVTTSAAFKVRKLESALADPENTDKAAALATQFDLPHFVWVMEIAPYDVYRRGRCTAEVVLDATAGSADDGFVYARVGKQLQIASKENTIFNTVSAPVEYPQYTHNLGHRGKL